MADEKRVALVVTGAGARGAYEAGALSAMLPALREQGHEPTFLFGTSAGALNVAGLAAFADEGPERATEELVKLWASVRMNQVVKVLASLGGDALRYLPQLVGVPTRLYSLLDTSKLAKTVEPLIPWARLHANVRQGIVKAVGVATTSAATGGTVVFVEKHATVAMPPHDAKRNISYVEVEKLTVQHVLASAAIPVAFRPVLVTMPEDWRGWYLDGGTRLNAPVKPAIAFGADHVAVVATHPVDYPVMHLPDKKAPRPDLFAAAAEVLHGALADRMVEDMHTLAKINALVDAHPNPPRSGSGGGRRYQTVKFAFAGPTQAEDGSIGREAEAAYHRQFRNLAGIVRGGSLLLLSRMIGGRRADHGELLSYLYFDPEFTSAAAELGRRHVEQNPPRMRVSI